MKIIQISIVSLFFSLVFILAPAWSCTGIQLKTLDGAAINGRTVEFGLNLELSGLIIPRQMAFKGTLPDGSAGLAYTAKYAAMGGGMYGEMAIADGINEKGLAIGDFYFPGFAEYATITADNKKRALSPTQFSNWILTQFATVAEVKQALKSVVIAPTTPKGWPVLPPFHYVVYDQTGQSIVIEPIKGELKVYDNPLGILTNSPTFDWHMLNLGNYTNLSPINAPAVTVDGVTLQQYGEGSGLHGLPGDFTPPSRFVRAAIFTSLAIPHPTAQEGVFQVFHILNQFDIPVGSVRQRNGKRIISEYTLATTVRDSKNLKYYFKTYDDQNIKMIDLNKFNLNAKTIKTFSMQGPQEVTELTTTDAKGQ